MSNEEYTKNLLTNKNYLKIYEEKWTILNIIQYPSIRKVTEYVGILNDLESHIRANHPYKDASRVTHSHEVTHGINADIRNKYTGKAGFYLLHDKAVLLDNPPNLKLSDVATKIPPELRGISYQLYLIQSQQSWQSYPLYLFDELSAYINGSEAGLENSLDINSELLQSIEFSLYCSVLHSLANRPDILELQQLQLGRAKEILVKWPGNKSNIFSYLQKWQDNSLYNSYLKDSLSSFGTNNFL